MGSGDRVCKKTECIFFKDTFLNSLIFVKGAKWRQERWQSNYREMQDTVIGIENPFSSSRKTVCCFYVLQWKLVLSKPDFSFEGPQGVAFS